LTLPDWKFPLHAEDIVEGLVLETSKNAVTVMTETIQTALMPPDIAWTKATSASDILKPVTSPCSHPLDQCRGSQIAVSLEQKPKVQGALVAIDPAHGDVKALVGGYDFEQSKFDRAKQALRPTGSVFKPFVYTAAVDRGLLKPDDTILDARVNFGGYSPDNYDGQFKERSRFVKLCGVAKYPAVKVLAMVGIPNLIPYVRRFGVTSKIDPYLADGPGSRRTSRCLK
jgi:penicillin-binding protein 1A